jgi:hypothetical protein
MAVWFALFSADPQWLHACPMHGAMTVASHAGTATAAMHHGHGRTPSDAPGHACTCLGDCSAASSAPLISASLAAVPDVPLVAFTHIAPVLRRAPRIAMRQNPLPFATAPPAPQA